MNESFALNMRQAGNALRAVYVRELAAYFLTPLAYVFIAIFLIAIGSFTFQVGRFFDTNQADLAPFFLFHPWLYLVFLPAIAMRLWADEAREEPSNSCSRCLRRHGRSCSASSSPRGPSPQPPSC